MQSLFFDQIFDYMNHIVCFNKASKLNSICIAHCICYITMQIEGDNENFSCCCLKCCVYKVLLCILTSRKCEKLLLLINKNNYVISDNTLYHNIIIWGANLVKKCFLTF